MGKLSLLVLVLVVIGHQVILDSRADQEGASDSSAINTNNNGITGRQQQIQLLDQLAQDRVFGSNRIDDHSNVDLNKLYETHRYVTLPSKSDVDPYYVKRSMGTLKVLSPSEFYRYQLDQKRAFRDATEFNEDRDYNFAMKSLNPLNTYRFVGYQQPRAGRNSAHTLRDMLLSSNGLR